MNQNMRLHKSRIRRHFRIASAAAVLVILLLTGTVCFAAEMPSWYPDDVSSFTDFHNENAARVVDDADVFTDSEEYELTNQINELIEKHNMDFVIYTTNSSYGLSHDILAADFYQFNGYGIGSDYDGSVFMICFEPGNRGWFTAARGSHCRSYYTQDSINQLDDLIEDDMVDGNYFSAAKDYVSIIDQLYSTGKIKAPKNTGRNIGISAVIGLIAGLITMGVMNSGMKKVKVATNADPYVVRGSFKIRKSRDHFLYMHVTRTRRENNNRSGGGSSFSGGFSSSGGGSFSGGGRKF